MVHFSPGFLYFRHWNKGNLFSTREGDFINEFKLYDLLARRPGGFFSLSSSSVL